MLRSLLAGALLASVVSIARGDEFLKKTGGPAPTAKAVDTGDYLLGCTADQRKSVEAAVALAGRLLYKRVDDLKAGLKTMEGPPAALADAGMQAALKKHFGVPAKVGNHKGVMQRLVVVYEGMYSHLVDPLHWPKLSCEDEMKRCAPGTYGYTLPINGASTYLCPEFFDAKDPVVRADTVIHEMAHRQVPTSEDDFKDKGYYRRADPTPLGMTDSLSNSDSYSHFVTDGPKKKPS